MATCPTVLVRRKGTKEDGVVINRDDFKVGAYDPADYEIVKGRAQLRKKEVKEDPKDEGKAAVKEDPKTEVEEKAAGKK